MLIVTVSSDLFHFLKSSTTSGLTDPLVTLMLMVFGHFGIDGYCKLAKLFHHIRTAGPLGHDVDIDVDVDGVDGVAGVGHFDISLS